MSATCRFCSQKFANGQAVRAHLKGCPEYRSRPRNRQPDGLSLNGRYLGSESLKASLPEAAEADAPFDLVRQLGQQVTAERLRLELREVEEAHAELDRKAQAKKREREREARERAEAAQTAERERLLAQRQSETAQAEETRRETVECEKQSRRREAIQNVKRQVVDWWYPDVTARSDLKARALKEIETGLAPLAVEELPLSELVFIAEGIRDRLYRETKSTEEQAQRFVNRRRELIAHGTAYAARELRAVEDLSIVDVWRIERRVKEDLESIAGTESKEDVEDRAEAILEDEDIGWEDDEE